MTKIACSGFKPDETLVNLIKNKFGDDTKLVKTFKKGHIDIVIVKKPENAFRIITEASIVLLHDFLVKNDISYSLPSKRKTKIRSTYIESSDDEL